MVLLRLKEDYDGAEPSASSVSVLNLLALAHLTDDAEARKKVERTLGRYGERAGRAARVIPMMLAGLSTWHAGATQVVVLGSEKDARPLVAKYCVSCHSGQRPKGNFNLEAFKDEAAVRNTQDVDILLRRADLDAAAVALEKVGFVRRHVASIRGESGAQ